MRSARALTGPCLRGHREPYSNRSNDPAERDHQSKLGLLPLKWAVTVESKDH